MQLKICTNHLMSFLPKTLQLLYICKITNRSKSRSVQTSSKRSVASFPAPFIISGIPPG